MPFWYFIKILPLPPDVAHQSNLVDVRKYLLKEGDKVQHGTPIVAIENYWALMELRANGTGIVKKILFDSGTTVKIGDPVAIIGADGEAIPHSKNDSFLEIVKNKRNKPRP
jgi:pyruvate/2-oxoglutarate dehydrogenase complex dihydrolipoamide acyltransferase (E2) component